MTPSSWQHHVSQNHFQQIKVSIWIKSFQPPFFFFLAFISLMLSHKDFHLKVQLAVMAEHVILLMTLSWLKIKTSNIYISTGYLFSQTIYHDSFFQSFPVCNLFLRDFHVNCLRCLSNLFLFLAHIKKLSVRLPIFFTRALSIEALPAAVVFFIHLSSLVYSRNQKKNLFNRVWVKFTFTRERILIFPSLGMKISIWLKVS